MNAVAGQNSTLRRKEKTVRAEYKLSRTGTIGEKQRKCLQVKWECRGKQADF